MSWVDFSQLDGLSNHTNSMKVVNKLGLSWAKLSQAGARPGVGINRLLLG